MTLISKCMKKGAFEQLKATESAFEEIKKKLYQAPVLTVTNFDDLFEVERDASGVEIRAILIESKNPIAYFS